MNPFSGGLSGFSTALKPGLYAGLGAGIGQALAPNSGSALPSGFNNPLPAVNPSLARGTGNATTPQFSQYNPYASVSGASPGYNFFPATS